MRIASLSLAAVLVLASPAHADPVADEALIRAVYNGDLASMQAALRAGGSFNARDENGYTPLHWAAFRGFGVLAAYMLDRGATVDVPDANGYTPLMLAGWNGHDTVVRLLLSRGASRERRSRDGYTAYDFAVAQGHAVLFPLLRPRAGFVAPPTTRPSAEPEPETDGGTPSSEPLTEFIAVPSASPRATPRPSPTPTPGPTEPGNEFTAVAGMHLSRISFPIAGIHYRRTLHDWFSLRLGAEYGRTQAVKTGALDLGFTRLHAAVLSNGWLYVGGGATHITLGTLYAGGYHPSAVSAEAIAGLRLGLGPVVANVEGRFGVGGPSTATGGLGLRF